MERQDDQLAIRDVDFDSYFAASKAVPGSRKFRIPLALDATTAKSLPLVGKL